MLQSVDFVVVGGGIIGLSAAISMRQRGFSVTVLEAHSFAADVTDAAQRLYAINQASQVFLQTLDVWQHLDMTRVAPYERMHVWDAHTKAAIDFDARMLARDQLGVMLEEAVLKQALLQQAIALDVNLVAYWHTTAIDQQATAIVIHSELDSWSAQWLIVSDGARSATRELLAVDKVTWSYHQQAIVAKVVTEHPHQRTAFQIFCSKGPLAFLPMAHPQESSIVWSTSVAHAKALLAYSNDVFEQQVTNAFEARLGQVTLLSKRHTFPLQMQHVKRYSGARWVLMGDAAHTIHPMAGLGLNIGLADVMAWLHHFPPQRGLIPAEHKIRSYQRQRKHALWQMILFLQAMHVLFTHSPFPISALRGFGLTLCNRLPFVKRLLIEHAIGLS